MFSSAANKGREKGLVVQIHKENREMYILPSQFINDSNYSSYCS